MSTADSASADNAGESFTKEYVDKLKAENASKSEEMAKLKAFKSAHDDKQRDVIQKLQPDIASYLSALVEDNGDHAPEMQGIVDWSKGCHQSTSLETAMPLARVLSCASAQYKRTREEASANAERAGTLGSAMKELEETKADRDLKMQRINELEDLCKDRQGAMEKLQEELAKVGVLKDKFDFSKLASREAKCDEQAAAPIAAPGGVQQVLSHASKGVENELLGFVAALGSTASNRVSQSATAHAYLGATSGSVEGEIAAAVRGY